MASGSVSLRGPGTNLPTSQSSINPYPHLLPHGEDDSGSIIKVLSKVLTQLIDVNTKSNTRQHFVTKFQSSYAPGISIQGYLERINKYAKCSPNCFIVALIYIDRLIEIRNIVLTSLNVHRILITSVLLATKVFDDEFYKNAYYAKLGGVSTSEMNSLELEFLSLVNFKLYVSNETFEKYQQELQSFMTVSTSPVITPLNSIEASHLTTTPERNLGSLSETGPRIVVPEGDDRGDLSGPNTISPMRPLDVNFSVPRSLLFNPIVQLSSTISPSNTDISSLSSSTPSLFNPEDCIYYPPNHSAPWLSSNSSLSSSATTLPSMSSSFPHDSPRSLVSYPSSDPSPTLPSAPQFPHIYSQQSIFSQTCCQKQDSNLHQEMLPSESHLLLHPSNGGVGGATSDMEGIYEYPHPRTMMDGYNYPDNTYPLSYPTHQPYPVRTNPYGVISSHPHVDSSLQPQCFSSNHSTIPLSSTLPISQQKCPSRQRVSSSLPSYPHVPVHSHPHSHPISAVVHTQQYNTRIYPNYQPRHYQNPCEIQGGISQFDMSGNGNVYHPALSQQLPSHYPPNGCGLSSLNPHHLNGNQSVQFTGCLPYQSNQFAGGYFYQPVPSPLIPGPTSRFLGSSSTPNSVTDIFGPPHQSYPPHGANYEEMGCRRTHSSHPPQSQSNSQHYSTIGFGGHSHPSLSHNSHPPPQYYSWGEVAHDGMAVPSMFPSYPEREMSSCTSSHPHHLNAYPSSSLFYPMALRT